MFSHPLALALAEVWTLALAELTLAMAWVHVFCSTFARAITFGMALAVLFSHFGAPGLPLPPSGVKQVLAGWPFPNQV